MPLENVRIKHHRHTDLLLEKVMIKSHRQTERRGTSPRTTMGKTKIASAIIAEKS